jgi:prepilin-type N-terminal cleavage/methylation domain-containing protein
VHLIINTMMNFFLHKNRVRVSASRGFTLIETLVSTMIITLVILGPLTVASNASSYARLTKDTLIANYLAQEAIELLRHQQDSVYIRCIQATVSSCVAVNNETPQEAAWRIFKERMGSNPQGISCFYTDNPIGCAFDVMYMTANQDSSPTKHTSTQAPCAMLYIQTSTGLYVCAGSFAGQLGYAPTRFSRSVSLTALPTLGGADQPYNDDIRVTVTVTFKQPNGYLKQVKVVDFLHARS